VIKSNASLEYHNLTAFEAEAVCKIVFLRHELKRDVQFRRTEYSYLDLVYVAVVSDRLCGLVVGVLGYRSGGPGSIPGTTRFYEKKKKKENSSGSGTGSTQPHEYN
jgi:hypothetical protein